MRCLGLACDPAAYSLEQMRTQSAIPHSTHTVTHTSVLQATVVHVTSKLQWGTLLYRYGP